MVLTLSGIIMNKIIILYFLLISISTTYTVDYWYPVAILADNRTVLLIEQHTLNDISLTIWDTKNNTRVEGVWSIYNPAGVQMLPDESGFSFIDNGRIRIQYFNKRSPKTIESDIYLTHINGIRWISPYEFYCSAFYEDAFEIFHCAIDGTVTSIARSKTGHCRYPQKVDNHLFYIEEYRDDTNKRSFCMREKVYDDNSLLDCGSQEIIFLTMLNNTEGFVIEYRPYDNNCTRLEFIYHHLIKRDTQWYIEPRFTFSIPSAFLSNTSESRIFESILPLIPTIYGESIYFVSAHNSSHDVLELYSYDLTRDIITHHPVDKDAHQSCFVPKKISDYMIVGGNMKFPQQPNSDWE
jgi:hypothetical protein